MLNVSCESHIFTNPGNKKSQMQNGWKNELDFLKINFYWQHHQQSYLLKTLASTTQILPGMQRVEDQITDTQTLAT